MIDDARLAVLAAYCHVDLTAPDDVLLLKRFYAEAVAYLLDANVPMPDEKADPYRRAKYDGCVDALVLDYWDNRGSQIVQVSIMENPAFRRKLNQLKLTAPVVPEVGTTLL